MTSDNPYQTPFATEPIRHGRTRRRRRTRFELFTEIATGFCLVLYCFGLVGSIIAVMAPIGTTRAAAAGQLLLVVVLMAIGWISISRRDLDPKVAIVMSWISMSPIVVLIALFLFTVVPRYLTGS